MTSRSRKTGGFAAAVALASFAAVPAQALPARPVALAVRPLALAVTFTPRFASPLERSPIVGELDLYVRADGAITGFYRPESDRSEIPLTGARAKNDAAFLDIGLGFESFHVDGRLTDRTATPALEGSARIGGAEYGVRTEPCLDARGVRSILCQ